MAVSLPMDVFERNRVSPFAVSALVKYVLELVAVAAVADSAGVVAAGPAPCNVVPTPDLRLVDYLPPYLQRP